MATPSGPPINPFPPPDQQQCEIDQPTNPLPLDDEEDEKEE